MSTTHVRVHASEGAELVSVLREVDGDDQLTCRALRDPGNQAYAAWRDDHLVGAAVVRWRPGSTSEILYMAIRKEDRGNGHGREMLKHLVAELPAFGNRLVVGAANSSLDDLAFYQRCGFRIDAVKRDYFDQPQPQKRQFGILMRDMIVLAYELSEGPVDESTAVPFVSEAERASLEEVQLLLIPGSTRFASSNHAVLRTIRTFTPHSVLFDGLAELPQFNPDAEATAAARAVSALRHQIAVADIVVLCTPEYAGTLPGSFKNLIDWTVGGGDLYRKPVAWINVAAPGRGGGVATDLARVLGYIDAQVLEPGGIHMPFPAESIGADGTVSDPAYLARLRHAVAGLVRAQVGRKESTV